MSEGWQGPLEKIDDYRWMIPASYMSGMRVPGLIYADENLIKSIRGDRAPQQVANAAHLPGIVKCSIAMPDIHWGYGLCLTRDAKILTDLGFYKPIKEFEKDWFNQSLRSVDLNSKRPIGTPILKFIKLKPKSIFKITTKNGDEIKATGDHPLLTVSGMRPIKELSQREKVAIFPFKGVPYEKPSNDTIITEKDIRRTLLKLGRKPHTPGFEIILQKLKERSILPLTYNHPKLPYILKIMGFVFGDASMNFIGKRGDGVFHFAGKPQDLEEAKKDLKKIGYTPGPIHFRKKRSSRINNIYYNCYGFNISASSLVVLLETLGVPRGSKVNQAYRIPKWIFKAPLWQKRLFLASLFGCELRRPHRRLERRGYFNCPVFPMAKRENLIKNAMDFLRDISKLLKEFGVKSLYIDKRKRHRNTKGEISWALELIISSKPENLFNLWSKIGFEYNSERFFNANAAVQYLKFKQKILREKDDAIKIAIPKLLKERLSYQKIALQLAGNPLTKRFIIDICWKLNKGREIIPRVPANFPLFENYLKENTKGLGQSGMVWDEIKTIEKISYQDFVYDFTVSHSDHNFIADNFVVSNCIGGVVATDVEAGGVVTPGGIGFDVNCLDGDSKILLDNGAYIRIKDFEKDFKQRKISCMNFERKSKEETFITRFMKIKPSNRVFEIKTLNGNKIIATEDHPFWTPDGMIPLKSLNIEDVVAVYPFEGAPYEEPSDEIIIDEKDIKRFLLSIGKDSRGHGLEQIIIQLKRRGLLPLRYNSPQLPYLLKTMGYNFGDGNIYFTSRTKKGFTWFYGKKEDLEKIKQDIEKIGFKCSKPYLRIRDHEMDTMYSKVKFRAETFSCKTDTSAFATLLVCLGTPLDSKTSQAFRVPAWIMEAPLWQKRLFLAGFFGAEMSSPKTLTGHGYNFYCPTISMNKYKEFVKNGKEFLRDLSDLLKEFNVSTAKISESLKYKNKDGKISIRLKLQLSNKPNNLINLYSKIGFEYNQKRKMLSNVAAQYLKMKESVIKEKECLADKARKLAAVGLSAKSIYKELDTNFVNLNFVERTIYEGRRKRPRFFGPDYITFDEFFEYTTGGMDNSGMVWDTIESIREIEFDDYVYDFTVNHEDHNFIADNFVVSNCGVRLMRTNLTEKEVRSKLDNLVHALFSKIPAGVGSKSDIKVNDAEEREIMIKGARWAVEKRGLGTKEDLEHTEDKGCMEGADPDKVSERAFERGRNQSGTLGSGNHFLEVQVVDEIYDEEAAGVFNVDKGSITIMIHCGSRGFGYQICDDYSKGMVRALSKYNINVPDRQLACAPVKSVEGKDYIAAMKCAANYAWNNRQCIMHRIRGVFERVFETSQKDLGMSLIWDVAHNIGKFEKYNIDGKDKLLFVHRKGATRAFGPDNPALPDVYRKIGQPVIIPGDMGRNSYLLLGTTKAEKESFASTAHGAGRLMSRTAAMHAEGRHTLLKDLAAKGIKVMAAGRDTLAEEAPYAYKNVNEVVDVVHKAGISKKVCRMRPIGVIKG